MLLRISEEREELEVIEEKEEKEKEENEKSSNINTNNIGVPHAFLPGNCHTLNSNMEPINRYPGIPDGPSGNR